MKLKQALNQRGMSQAELARAGGWSESQVSLWVNGKRLPTVRNLQKIAKILGMAVTDWTALKLTNQLID